MPDANTIAHAHHDQCESSTSGVASGPSSEAIEISHGTAEPRRIPNESHQGYLDTGKARFIEKHSSASHARYLGIQLGLSDPPRLHAFAYHLGVRKEQEGTVKCCLIDMIGWRDVRALIDVYVAVVHPIFGFLDLDDFVIRCHSHWHEETQSLSFEAVVGGVITFASLFSDVLAQELETALVSHVKAVLADPAESRTPSLDAAMGWILRTLYVRATGRPYEVCSTSLTSVNMIQALGLHKAIDSVQPTGPENLSRTVQYLNTRTMRIAAIAQSLHVLFSFDYGRSILDIGSVDLTRGCSEINDHTIHLQELARAIPLNLIAADPITMRQCLEQSLQQIMIMSCNHDFILLLQAEICFSIYRRLRVLNPNLQESHVRGVLRLGTATILAALRLSAQKQPWWNIVSTIFQFVCVMLSINTPESLEGLPKAMEALQMVNEDFKTTLSSEALSTARILVKACMERKKSELSLLELAGRTHRTTSPTLDGTRNASAEIDLEAFLHPMCDMESFGFLDIL